MVTEMPRLKVVFVGVGAERTKEYRDVGVLCILGRHESCTPRIYLGYREVRVCTCPCGAHVAQT